MSRTTVKVAVAFLLGAYVGGRLVGKLFIRQLESWPLGFGEDGETHG